MDCLFPAQLNRWTQRIILRTIFIENQKAENWYFGEKYVFILWWTIDIIEYIELLMDCRHYWIYWIIDGRLYWIFNRDEEKQKALINDISQTQKTKNIKRKRKLQPHNITGMHLMHLHCGPLPRFQIFTLIRKIK